MSSWFDYSDFYTMIKTTYAGNYYHIVDDVWLIKTEETPAEILSKLVPLMNFNTKERVTKDQIFVFELGDWFNYDGYGAKSIHDYIKSMRTDEKIKNV